jgi:hypothetical protein
MVRLVLIAVGIFAFYKVFLEKSELEIPRMVGRRGFVDAGNSLAS